MVTEPYRLSVNQAQLVLKKDDTEHKAPVEDLGFVILDHPYISITQAVAQELAANNVALIFCGSNHHPVSLMLNLDGNHLQGELFRQQAEAAETLKKNLWKQTVEAKIKNQAALIGQILKLKPNQKGNEALARIKRLAQTVLSGDTGNNEAQAARYYWNVLFGNDFSRERFGDPPNNMLNYGYAILRAATARSLTGSGLLPTLGIHHRNRYNAYCLADDIMEPYRPFIDLKVIRLLEEYELMKDLSKEVRARLLEVLQTDACFTKVTRPLLNALSVTTASLARCFAGEQKKIEYPALLPEK